MIRSTIAAGMLLALTAALEATPVIDGGTYYLELGVTAQLTVTVSGGDAVPGIEFVVQIGDGGVANGGATPRPRSRPSTSPAQARSLRARSARIRRRPGR